MILKNKRLIVLLLSIVILSCQKEPKLSEEEKALIEKERIAHVKKDNYTKNVPLFVEDLVKRDYKSLESKMEIFSSLTFLKVGGGKSAYLESRIDILNFLQEDIKLNQLVLGGNDVNFSLLEPDNIEYTTRMKYKFGNNEILFYLSKNNLIDSIVCRFEQEVYDSVGFQFNPKTNSKIRDYIFRYKEKKIVYGPYYAPFSDYSAIEFYDDKTCYFVVNAFDAIVTESTEYWAEGNNIFVRNREYSRVDNYIINSDGNLSTKDSWKMIYWPEKEADKKLLKGMRYNFNTFEYYETPIVD